IGTRSVRSDLLYQVASAATSDEPYKFMKQQAGMESRRRSNKSLCMASPLKVHVESLANRRVNLGSLSSIIANEGTVTKRVICSRSMIDVNWSASALTALETASKRRPMHSGPRVSNSESTKLMDVLWQQTSLSANGAILRWARIRFAI